MAWIKPEFSKGDVDRAGHLLASGSGQPSEVDHALNVLNNWRSCHSFPLNTFQMGLRNNAALDNKSFLIAQRLKRVPSMLQKLHRLPSMKLSQMQDIGGCRGVVNSVKNVRNLMATYEKSHIKHVRVNEKDYINQPKNSGYRSIHLVYRYTSDKRTTYNGMLIEIQIRSRLQHAWATAVEVVGILLNHSLKSSEGPEKWLGFFAQVSSAFAEIEGSPSVPGTPVAEALKAEIRKAAAHLAVKKKLGHARDVLSITESHEHLKDAHYYLLTLDPRADTLTLSGYHKRDIKKATQDYSAAEELARLNVGPDVVLVSADSLGALRQAYPNYYLDTQVFLEKLSEYLS